VTSDLSSASGATEISLRVNGLTRRYGDLIALQEATFALHRGEILGVIGSSGSGKTTLLRCLDLLEPFDSGSIEYEQRTMLRSVEGEGLMVKDVGTHNFSPITEDMACRLRRGIGFVFQGFNLWNERTVLDNLTLAPRVVRGEAQNDASEKAVTLCRQFGLADKLNARPWQLSGGQRQRVAILRALMMNPRIMLLDEVTSALDPVLTVEVMVAIRELRDEGLTMILVTHHLHFATNICDRLAFLSKGRIVQLDTPRQLQMAPANEEVERFLNVLADAT
jgi:polar amino acid transport system ATP-binding protein